jgi:arylsulfatase A-like enzyme
MQPTIKLIAAFCIAALISAAATTSAAESAQRPNIVLILCDDLGYGDVHALNPERGKIPTPNIDRLAAQGMTFTDAHSSSSVCTPTRYALLTGRYSWRSRLQQGVLNGMSEPLLAPGRMTIASFLQNQGYATACLGKWHLGLGFGPQQFTSPLVDSPLNHGFDHFFGIPASLDMPPFVWIEDDRITEEPTAMKTWVRPGPAAPSFEAVDVLPTLTKRAAQYIHSHANAEKPFFLYLPFASPHTPIVPTPEWQGKSGLGDYADFVMQTDAAVGEVLKALDDAGVRDNTLVIFTSDNGFAPMAQPKHLEEQGHFPSASFRGYKADIYEGGHRIPLIVRWPGVVTPGARCDQLVGQVDLFRTTADILQQKLPDAAAEDSFSLLPLLKGGAKPVRESLVHHSAQGCFAIRAGNWKLALCPDSGSRRERRQSRAGADRQPGVQLFDMAADPAEQHNVVSKHPEVVERLTDLLKKSVADGRTTPGAPQQNDVAVNIVKPPQRR